MTLPKLQKHKFDPSETIFCGVNKFEPYPRMKIRISKFCRWNFWDKSKFDEGLVDQRDENAALGNLLGVWIHVHMIPYEAQTEIALSTNHSPQLADYETIFFSYK